MGRFAAIAIALALGGCGKPSARDDCASIKPEFLKSMTGTFDERISAMPPADQPRARAFFDGKLAHATAHYDASCNAVTADDWRCVREAIERGGLPHDACEPVVDRFMDDLLDWHDPDHH